MLKLTLTNINKCCISAVPNYFMLTNEPYCKVSLSTTKKFLLTSFFLVMA